MTFVEQKYNQKLDEVGPQGRMKILFSLFFLFSQMLRNQFTKETQNLSMREFKIKRAYRFYLSDPKTKNLLSRIKT